MLPSSIPQEEHLSQNPELATIDGLLSMISNSLKHGDTLAIT